MEMNGKDCRAVAYLALPAWQCWAGGGGGGRDNHAGKTTPLHPKGDCAGGPGWMAGLRTDQKTSYVPECEQKETGGTLHSLPTFVTEFRAWQNFIGVQAKRVTDFHHWFIHS